MERPDFKTWYLEFREEVCNNFGVGYAISVSSWTFSDAFQHFYDRGLTPKGAIQEYIKLNNVKHLQKR